MGRKAPPRAWERLEAGGLSASIIPAILAGIGNLSLSLWSKEGYELLVLPGEFLHLLPACSVLLRQLLDIGSKGLYLPF